MDGNNDESLKIAKNSTPCSLRASASSEQVAEIKRKKEQVALIREIKRKKDYYKILGLENKCSAEDIRRAFRKLSLKVHPDKNPAPGAEDSFKKVLKAYECLSNEESREKYDLATNKRVRVSKPKHVYSQFYPDFEEKPFALIYSTFEGQTMPTMKMLTDVLRIKFNLQPGSFKMEYKDEKGKMIQLPKEDDLGADNYLRACLERFISLGNFPTIRILVQLI